MADQPDTRARIEPLTSKFDYGLWRVRVMTACSSKDVSDVFEESSDGSSSTDAAFQKRQRRASDIIVTALADESLRVVMTSVGDPKEMIEKLDDRYRCTSTASKISKITELVSVRYKSVRKDVSHHVDKMAGIVEELNHMGMSLDKTLTVGILVASIEAPELRPVATAIKTLAEDNLEWESVTGRLIEEWKNITPTEADVEPFRAMTARVMRTPAAAAIAPVNESSTESESEDQDHCAVTNGIYETDTDDSSSDESLLH